MYDTRLLSVLVEETEISLLLSLLSADLEEIRLFDLLTSILDYNSRLHHQIVYENVLWNFHLIDLKSALENHQDLGFVR